MIEKSLKTTLRLHSAPITCIEPFYLPSTITYTFGRGFQKKEYPLFNPSLITADESGLIIWWNLSTRRPLGIWKAHDDSILSIQQLGINWNCDPKHNFSIPALSIDEKSSYGQLLTHSKDGTIKIWKIIDLIDSSSVTSGFKYSSLLKKKLYNSTDSSENPTPPLLFQMPVNTMNFSNVIMNSTGTLITPATTDSEGWDLYNINLNEEAEHLKLKRIVQNHKVDLKRSSDEKITELDDDVENELDLTKRGRTGVIMKFIWIDSNKFVVGYESGTILGFEILVHNTNEKSSKQVKQFLQNDELSGNPITSLCFDRVNNKLLCASAGSKILILEMSKADSSNKFKQKSKLFETKHKGVGDISCDVYTNTIAIITWDGYTRMYEYDDTKILKFIFKMRRQIPAISNSKEISENQQSDIQQNNTSQTQKANVLKFTEKQVDPRKNKDSIVNIHYNNGLSKNVVRRNREEIYGERWLFIGYQDGKVSVYLIN